MSKIQLNKEILKRICKNLHNICIVRDIDKEQYLVCVGNLQVKSLILIRKDFIEAHEICCILAKELNKTYISGLTYRKREDNLYTLTIDKTRQTYIH